MQKTWLLFHHIPNKWGLLQIQIWKMNSRKWDNIYSKGNKLDFLSYKKTDENSLACHSFVRLLNFFCLFSWIIEVERKISKVWKNLWNWQMTNLNCRGRCKSKQRKHQNSKNGSVSKNCSKMKKFNLKRTTNISQPISAFIEENEHKVFGILGHHFRL